MARQDGALPTVHTYGSGRDAQQIRDAVDAGGLPVVVHAGTDHASEELRGYRVFVNPSTSEVRVRVRVWVRFPMGPNPNLNPSP